MLENLFVVPEDPLLKLIGAFKEDPRPDKIDLGVGVYRDASGRTPVMQAVKLAEAQLLETQDSKSYVGLAGDLEYLDLMGHLVFGGIRPKKTRFAYLQTPGGSAALRLGGDIIKRSNPDAQVWVGLPCWSNHTPIFTAAGLTIKTYDYLDAAGRNVNSEAMFSALSEAKPGDIVLLQGCCHNPSGADLSPADWQGIADICNQKGLTPFIDIAYQGLGDGLIEDLAGMNIIMEQVPEALVSVSCSKNFGLYRERTGALYVMAPNIKKADVSLTNLFELARTSYSMPPDHGAAIVRTILKDEALKQVWKDELGSMRARIYAMRNALADQLEDAGWDYLRRGRGMFSIMPLSSEQIENLRQDHAIYMAGNGRINFAGFTTAQVSIFAEQISKTMT